MVKTLRIAFVQWPENFSTDHPKWPALESIRSARPDILITNELPFGPWIAEDPVFAEENARLSIDAHEKGLQGLIRLNLPAVISSRPVWAGQRLANEAFALENGTLHSLHRKQYFPNEPGWFESNWYAGEGSGFEVAEVLETRVGVLLCTDAMFNECARAYGRQKASLIVIPRASGLNLESWKIAGAMASLVSGAYVVSSNRVGTARGGTQFGGGGYAYAPHATLIATTDASYPVKIFDLDPSLSSAAQSEYPCYVSERVMKK
jgi:N-carbamoylputrescine amidase